MKPLIKWTGGKRTEIPFLKPHYPASFNRIVEPFAGGAAVAWDLAPLPAILNDVNGDLIRFYRALQNVSSRNRCHQALLAIGARRNRLHAWVAALDASEVQAFFQEPAAWVNRHRFALLEPNTRSELDERFGILLLKHGTSKAGRVAQLEKKHTLVFTLDLQRAHLETALQSAWYETLREVYNHQIELDDAWQAAAWWSVRVLCYSGMFRFSSKGLFNVPYGGISYNARDFSASFPDLFGADRVEALGKCTIENLDFADLFAKYQGFSSTDFVFVDPPYDSAFSQYNVEGDFVANDQIRLRDTLEGSHAKWMMVIKRTGFIESLYAGRGHHCYVFDKHYAVNFRNRHDRGVQHLVATNYPLTLAGDSALRPL